MLCLQMQLEEFVRPGSVPHPNTAVKVSRRIRGKRVGGVFILTRSVNGKNT
ncbi:hypothetical protein KIN20_021374 [Parelaphostrongylus tenuis]|uniref:Uncharacterized protein n=1 Tax=Parelaphostrongylus tenuis TaxID=148309 RepID=A0AAD5QW56_PARTN|nr:hypothetical protein KIN20_021374 [Parelaphostrongylus tenuis]